MKSDLVLKCSIAVKLIKSENYEKFCITAFSFSDPQMHYGEHRRHYFYQEVLTWPQLSVLYRITSGGGGAYLRQASHMVLISEKSRAQCLPLYVPIIQIPEQVFGTDSQ